MTKVIPPTLLEKFSTFGDLLRFLRRRAGLTQLELAAEVGYSDTQISRLEQNQRLPDIPTIEARFVRALELEQEPEALARLLELAAKVRREDSPAPGLCPYKGMNFFDEADADLFVGREALTARLVERLLDLVQSERPRKERFLAVVGASGSGKSSLVRAGLAPALRWRTVSADWQMHILTPTDHPLQSLATALTSEMQSLAAAAALMDDMALDSRSLQLFARRYIGPQPGARLLLVIDQFEELFALCRSEQERTAFIENLLAAASEESGPVCVVVALRADFYAHCADYDHLREALALNQQYIGAMNADELRRMIEESALRGRWEFEPGLIDLLLRDAGNEPGALPLLSHALFETWQRRRGRVMTFSGYASCRGVRGAIAETAETVFSDRFTPEQQAIARRIFLRLTELGDETALVDTRRRATFSELILKPEEAGITLAVLKVLADARLITTSEDTVEVAHEALIREWPTLRGWLEENREGLRLHRQLTDGAQEWQAANRTPEMLLRGTRLAAAGEWAARHEEDLNLLEKAFLDTSRAAEETEAAEREAQRRRELDALRRLALAERQRTEEQSRAAGLLRRRALYLLCAFAASLILAAAAFFSWNTARRTTAEALENQKIPFAQTLAAAAVSSLETDPERSILLALKSIEASSHGDELFALPEAESALHQAILASHVRSEWPAHQDAVTVIAFSPDGKILATGSQDTTTTLWDLDSGQSLPALKVACGYGVSAIVFSPNGTRLATGTEGGSVQVWETSSGRLLQTIEAHRGAVTSMAFSADGRRLITGGTDKSGIVWETSTGQKLTGLSESNAAVMAIAYNAQDGGARAATAVPGDEGEVRIWDIAGGEPQIQFEGSTPLAFSPDGQHIAATWSHGRDVNLWDVSGKAAAGYQGAVNTGRLTGHMSVVTNVTYSADGARLASAGRDGTTRIWDATTGVELLRLVGHTAPVKGLAFSPDGLLLATGDERGRVRIWDTRPGQALFSVSAGFELPQGASTQFAQPRFSADGKRLYTIVNAILPDYSTRSHIQVVDAANGVQLLSIPDTAGMNGAKPAISLALSPDDRALAAGYEDGRVRVLDAMTGEVLFDFEAAAPVQSLAFTADGQRLAAAGAGSTIGLWDVYSGELAATMTIQNGPVIDLDFSPDGKQLAIVTRYQRARLWDLASEESTYLSSLPDVTAMTYSLDGRQLATARLDGTVLVQDAFDGRELLKLRVPTGLVKSLAFSADGARLATTGEDGVMRVWDVSDGREVLRLPGGGDVAISPDGRRLATVSSKDAALSVYVLPLKELIALAESRLTRDLTEEECRQYLDVESCPVAQRYFGRDNALPRMK